MTVVARRLADHRGRKKLSLRRRGMKTVQGVGSRPARHGESMAQAAQKNRRWGEQGHPRPAGAVAGRDLRAETEPGTGSGAAAAVGSAADRRRGERMNPSVQPQEGLQRQNPLGQ